MRALAAAYTSDDSFLAGLLLAFGLFGIALIIACHQAGQIAAALGGF